ncbi:MAG: hypothetical protein K6L76_08035 [Agarilytica sp.]
MPFNITAPQVINPFHIPNSFKYSNAMADWAFYDVGALNVAEFNYLVNEQSIEGSVLVALPSDEKNFGIIKYRDFAELKAGSGKPLQRLSIAGVGSSDVGAAAFARTLANHYQEPVGAIVAGYGVADILQEGLGGWFVLGGLNRAMSMFEQTMIQPWKGSSSHIDTASTLSGVTAKSPDTETLLNILNDPARDLKSIAGHSKGCLSIALALQTLEKEGSTQAIGKAKALEVITVGSVVNLPEGYENVRQYIGDIDWFGGLNSRANVERITVKGAWHHLNTRFPYHLDLVEVLQNSTQ